MNSDVHIIICFLHIITVNCYRIVASCCWHTLELKNIYIEKKNIIENHEFMLALELKLL